MSAERIDQVHDAEFVVEEPAQEQSQALVIGPAQWMAIAVERDLDITKIERLEALYERSVARQAKAAFDDALARFQSLVPEIPKQKQGYGYLYAPLGDIERTIKGAMRDCGLAKKWRQVEEKDQITVYCVITHVKGHTEESPIGPVGWDLLEKTKQMNGLQHRAAVISYLQRYSLIAALGLATADDDTDGRDRAKKQEEKQSKASLGDQINQPRQTTVPAKIDRPQAQAIGNAARESGIPNAAATEILKRYGFAETKEVTVDKFKAVLKEISDWTGEVQAGELKVPAVKSAKDRSALGERAQKLHDEFKAATDEMRAGNVLDAATGGTRVLALVTDDKLASVIAAFEKAIKAIKK